MLEAASNDGYLLKHYRDLGIPVFGIEPAANIAEAAERNGIRTLCAFFGREEGERLAAEGFRCDVFHANNVLAHVADLNGFVAGLKAVLKPAGIASIEAPYLGDLVEKLEFDTVYHEHLCYFSATALDKLFARHGLLFADVERIPIHGGSLRMFVTHARGERSAAIQALLEEEAQGRPGRARSFTSILPRTWRVCASELMTMLKDLKKRRASGLWPTAPPPKARHC